MALTTEQLTKIEEKVGSWLGQSIAYGLGILGPAIAGWLLPKEPIVRACLLPFAVLWMLCVWLSLRVLRLQKELNTLKDGPAKVAPPVLTDDEFSILGEYVTATYELSPYDIERRLKFHGDDVLDAVDKLRGLGLIEPEIERPNMKETGFYRITRAGRQYVRKKTEGRA